MERPYRRCAQVLRAVRAPNQPGGEGRTPRVQERTHTHHGHAARTQRATGANPRNAQTALNGVPAGEGKGYPDETNRNTHRGEREGGGRQQGGG